MENTWGFTTRDIVQWCIRGGFVIWEIDEELYRQDAQWCSFRHMLHGSLSDFTATVHLGHVISRKPRQWNGVGLLIRAADSAGTVFGFIFTGQTREFSVVRVPTHRLVSGQDVILNESNVPCVQEQDR